MGMAEDSLSKMPHCSNCGGYHAAESTAKPTPDETLWESEAQLFEIVATAQDKARPDGFNAVECRAITKAIMAEGWRPPANESRTC
jgi:hypothetical protein